MNLEYAAEVSFAIDWENTSSFIALFLYNHVIECTNSVSLAERLNNL